MFREIDWSALRGASIFLGIFVVIGLSLIISSSLFLEELENRHKTAERYLGNARVEYRQLDGETVTVGTYFPLFERLQKAGLIGEEHRLSWLNALQNAGKRLRLSKLRYSISSREPYANFPVNDGPYRVYASDMELRVGLLHEGELFSLLGELDRHAIGVYSVVYCRLRRTGWERSEISIQHTKQAPKQTNIDSECVLRWYTLNRTDARADTRGR
uniref:Uncharacterized protein n=1 Tax=Candidatus Kentrum sp. MB TaxID=2138164 RepID=A0A451BG07_9GAMM|nr:MAG: hypothetical protein BECKMB1821I_GA0114274_11104 [Candidatus Kentron sp. MB]VFK77224.1 MAG: hypothetical protein BECKMB1821H_GA0114242_11124 [Candidatus Kentron sp. MB]